MNIAKFIEYGEANGLSSVQVFVSKSSKLSFKIYHKDIEGYSVADTQNLLAMGVYNGRCGAVTTEKIDHSNFPFLVDAIKESASINENEDFLDFYEGSKKYHKKNVYCKKLDEWPLEKKIETAKQIEERLLAFDKRISDVPTVTFQERVLSSELYNSHGLKLKQKSNYFYIYAEVVAKEGDQVKTGGNFFLDCDPEKFDIGDFTKKAAEEALAKFGGEPCDSGKYPTIIKSDVFADILDYFISQLSADEVEKHSSLLEGKIGEKIASSKLSISEKPLDKNVHFSYFDAEGVAKTNKNIVNNGRLLTYLHNRRTAKKFGVESTGNGSFEGSKIGISYSSIFVKPGKISFDELVKEVGNGVYITDIAGLGTGINPRSGDFSCQAEGFLIKDGKIDRPLSLITLSGNLLKMLKDIKSFDNSLKLLPSSFSVADVYIKSMNIGGK